MKTSTNLNISDSQRNLNPKHTSTKETLRIKMEYILDLVKTIPKMQPKVKVFTIM